jgi:sodium-dependent dicarboxylate transporter 2/3/5
MASFHEALATAETYSPAEEQFNRRRRTVGTVAAPLAFVACWYAPMGLSHDAQAMAAIMALVVVLWLSEALPLAVSALLGPTLAVVMGVTSARTALAPFADPIIFLFLGGFILAQAMFVHGVDRRIAYTALASPAVGSSPWRILLVYVAVTTALSMWISNTATTAMMFPIGLSIVAHLARQAGARQAEVRRYATAMMLLTSFGASVGGMGTPVGTPPNLIGIGMLEKLVGVQVTFFQWMALGVPLVILLFVYLVAQFYVTSVRGLPPAPASTDLVRAELTQLGPVSRAETNVLVAFGTTVVLWLVPGVLAVLGLAQHPWALRVSQALPEGIVAVIGALLLFMLPVDWSQRKFTITWDEAARIDWGIILLYGGGLSLGELAFSTGLASALGDAVTSWLPVHSSLGLTMVFTAAAIIVSEAASNTASANMIIPIAIAVSTSAGIRPIEPVLGATLGASMGFMMPISTPPNAIVYSSGFVPIGQMMRHGIWLDLVAFVLIVGLVTLLGPVVF